MKQWIDSSKKLKHVKYVFYINLTFCAVNEVITVVFFFRMAAIMDPPCWIFITLKQKKNAPMVLNCVIYYKKVWVNMLVMVAVETLHVMIKKLSHQNVFR